MDVGDEGNNKAICSVGDIADKRRKCVSVSSARSGESNCGACEEGDDESNVKIWSGERTSSGDISSMTAVDDAVELSSGSDGAGAGATVAGGGAASATASKKMSSCLPDGASKKMSSPRVRDGDNVEVDPTSTPEPLSRKDLI